MALTNLNMKIDEELKQEFKVIATKNKENMTDVVVSAIKDYVEKNKEWCGFKQE